MKTGTAAAMLVALACTCAASPKPAPAPAPAAAQPTKPAAATDCGAGHLPRVTEKSFAPGGVAAFFTSAAKGTVAVAWDGTSARVIDRCRLDGRYVEAKGKGLWRFRATNRVLFRTDEIAGECRTATHLVAAYITRNGAAQVGAAPVASQMNGILVPLPCPPAEDSKPATGCIALGSTGPERHQRADVIMTEIPRGDARRAEVAKVLEVFALIPDDPSGIDYASEVSANDCPLYHQAIWLAFQYLRTTSDKGVSVVKLQDADRRHPPPTLNWQCSDFDCACTPVFLKCFPDQFEPLFFGAGHWEPAEPQP